ncbi:Hypothetical predicted protein [Pelobates cultripes]|uniref:Uncharacterized protein n=1 Tax=Pelobates cultripes TaxID=61616 RepID=A0AAD1TFV6_PELCU|nr:Hypothetical predicted protein [Pelobates cultripes]
MADQQLLDITTKQRTSESGCYLVAENCCGSLTKPYAQQVTSILKAEVSAEIEGAGEEQDLPGHSFSGNDAGTHNGPTWAEDRRGWNPRAPTAYAGNTTPQAAINNQDPQQPPTGEELCLPRELQAFTQARGYREDLTRPCPASPRT